MGTVGSGWSTAIARIYMAGVLIGYLLLVRPQTPHRTAARPPSTSILRASSNSSLWEFRAAIQFTLETGVFATVTTLIAKLGAIPLATHQIALNTVAFTYMVPLGISSAAAVRVGQALGRKDPQGAGAAGGTAIFRRRRVHDVRQYRSAPGAALDRARLH